MNVLESGQQAIMAVFQAMPTDESRKGLMNWLLKDLAPEVFQGSPSDQERGIEARRK